MEPPKRDFPVIPVSLSDFSRQVPVHLVTGNLPVTSYKLPVTSKGHPGVQVARTGGTGGPYAGTGVDQYLYSPVQYDLTRSNFAKIAVKFAKKLLKFDQVNTHSLVFNEKGR